jgi:hypothetical protein
VINNFEEHASQTHVVKTTYDWKNTSIATWTVPIGVLCVELCNDGKTKIKIGDDKHVYSQLPYICDCDLSNYVTHQELIQTVDDSNVMKLCGIFTSTDSIKNPKFGYTCIIKNPAGYNLLYLYANDKWNLIGSIPKEIDLTQYAKITYVDEKFNDVKKEIKKIHTHSNLSILELIEEPYTTAEKEKLSSLTNFDSSNLEKRIRSLEIFKHNHSHYDILEKTTAAFTIQTETTINDLVDNDKVQDARLDELEKRTIHEHENKEVLDQITQQNVDEWHTHKNKKILDKTTASFTVEYKEILDNLDFQVYVFSGATNISPGRKGLVPAPMAGDQDKFLKGDGTWTTIEQVTPIKYIGGKDILISDTGVNEKTISYIGEETQYISGTDIEIIDNEDGTKTVNYVGEDDDTTYDFHGKNGINVTELSDYTSYLNFDDSSYDWNPDSGGLTVKNRDARSWTAITPSKELPPGIYELTRTNTTGTLQILHYPFDPSYDYNSDDDEEKPESEKKTKHISEGESTLTFTLSEDTRILIKSNYSTSNVFPLTNYLHLEKISSDLKEYEIGLLPATHSTLGGVIIGEGINLDQDGTISVDMPDVPQYTAGEGISIKDTPTKTISIEQTEFVRGNINNDGSDDDITLYLRTNDFDIIIDPTYEFITLSTKVLEQDESYIWKLFFYEENGTFISCTSDFHFDTEQVSIPNNTCYLKIVMKRADDTIDNFYEEIEICNIILSGEKIREISLKPATTETLGGIKVGDNLSIDENGVLSAHDDYDDSEIIRRLDQIEEDYVIEPDHLILNVVE